MFSLQMKYKGFPPRKSDYNTAVRDVLEDTALHWHDQFFEQHFTEAGAQRYGYFKRKGEGLRGTKAFKRSYVGRKERTKGHNRPLFFTGEAYRESKIPRVVATSKQARVILSRKFNFKHPKSQIVMRDEATRVLPSEQNELIEFTGRRLDAKLAKFSQATQ